MEQFVCQHEIDYSVFIDIWAKILMIAARETPLVCQSNPLHGMKKQNLRANAVMGIKHACNTVEPESIKLVFVHPKP